MSKYLMLKVEQSNYSDTIVFVSLRRVEQYIKWH